jgi:hypothetical protein
MLHKQEYGGHASIHDSATAGALGLAGAPIEGPTHFSQLDPLAYEFFGDSCFERGCISAHFETMVVEGEEVRASATATGPESAVAEAWKPTGERVLAATITLGAAPTELETRLARVREREPGPLHIVDRVEVGWRAGPWRASVTFGEPNGALYPFTLGEKLALITEPSAWYEQGVATPWGRPVLPSEMLSVLVYKDGEQPPVRQPAVGLFVDLEVRRRAPVFVDESYSIEREVVAVGQTRRVESFWTRSIARDRSGAAVLEVLLHEGFFKDPPDGETTTVERGGS